jgi:hypothetical protein
MRRQFPAPPTSYPTVSAIPARSESIRTREQFERYIADTDILEVGKQVGNILRQLPLEEFREVCKSYGIKCGPKNPYAKIQEIVDKILYEKRLATKPEGSLAYFVFILDNQPSAEQWMKEVRYQESRFPGNQELSNAIQMTMQDFIPNPTVSQGISREPWQFYHLKPNPAKYLGEIKCEESMQSNEETEEPLKKISGLLQINLLDTRETNLSLEAIAKTEGIYKKDIINDGYCIVIVLPIIGPFLGKDLSLRGKQKEEDVMLYYSLGLERLHVYPYTVSNMVDLVYMYYNRHFTIDEKDQILEILKQHEYDHNFQQMLQQTFIVRMYGGDLSLIKKFLEDRNSIIPIYSFLGTPQIVYQYMKPNQWNFAPVVMTPFGELT